MNYFSGVYWRSADHVERCRAWIDRCFPDNHALNFAYSGRILFALEQGPLVTLPAPVAWWTLPGPRYTYGVADGETWDHYYVSFSGTRADRMVSEGLLQRHPGYAFIHQPEHFRQHFEELLSALRERPGDNPQAVNLLEGLLLQAREQRSDSNALGTPLEGRIRELMRCLRDEPAEARNWGREARSMGVSEVHFRRLFKQFSSLPPGQYAIQAALDAAARLLQRTHMPVKVVAGEVGYDDIQHFTKMFRKRFGVPPAAYRNEMQASGSQTEKE